jgi:hypothetical protein
MKQFYKALKTLTEYMDLKKPISIRFADTLELDGVECNALYYPIVYGKKEILDSHVIELACKGRKNSVIIDCLAHELIHAWQMENGADYQRHTGIFEFMALALGDTFGYTVAETQQ